RTSSTIAFSSPRQAPIAPQTPCAHAPAGTVSALRSREPIAAVRPTTSARPAMTATVQTGPGRTALRRRSRELVHERDEQAPVALDGGEAERLAGRVGRADLRAEREHVEPRNLAADHGRLESAVHRPDDRLLAEELLVDRASDREHGRAQVRAPAAVV